MSNKKQETIADIVDEIRAQNQGLPEDNYALSPLVCDLLSLANRIEAAAKREVAELRECLKMAVVNARIARTCYAFGLECDSCGQSCNARKWKKVIEATKGAGDGFKRD